MIFGTAQEEAERRMREEQRRREEEAEMERLRMEEERLESARREEARKRRQLLASRLGLTCTIDGNTAVVVLTRASFSAILASLNSDVISVSCDGFFMSSFWCNRYNMRTIFQKAIVASRGLIRFKQPRVSQF
jgi:hypothetical protein